MRLASRGRLARALLLVSIRPSSLIARIGLPIAASLLLGAGCGGGGGLFQPQYEYEEELFLALDGSATLHVNSSIAALNALRGAGFDRAADHAIGRREVQEYFSAPGVEVTRIDFSSRRDRRYVHVRMRVEDVRQLGATPRFGWSTYVFARDGDLYVYRQRVGPPARGSGAPVQWRGDELVGFRLHLPSRIVYHNVERVRRGNILAWEQSLTDRLAGRPVEIEARMETRSILYRTLGLFGATILLVAATFGVVLWRLVRRGRRRPARARHDAGVRA
jgi:hypothetical protein